MEQEHRLTYKAAITRTPSDFLCSDGELAECINLATDTEELKPMVQPTSVMSTVIATAVRYIHKYKGEKRYIYISFFNPPRGVRENCRVNWAKNVNGVLTHQQSFDLYSNSHNLNITSIGKTLIVTDDDGLHYFRWKETTYKQLGELKSPDVKLYLLGSLDPAINGPFLIQNSLSYNGILSDSGQLLAADDYPEATDKYNDMVKGLYAKNKKSVGHKKGFCEPFMARIALELYDGSYTHISEPIMLFPSISTNSYMTLNTGKNQALLKTAVCYLYYKNNCFTDASHMEETQFYADWDDIVKDIVIFVSDGVGIYDVTVDQPEPESWAGRVFHDAIFTTSPLSSNDSEIHTVTASSGFNVLEKREINEIKDDLVSSSVFYKLCSIGKTGDGTAHNSTEKIQTHILENLTTQDRLEYDDYFSNSYLCPKFVFAYNSRLNLANIKRTMFEGFGYFLPWDNSESHEYTFDVTVRTDDGDKVVRHVENTTQKQGIFFYYPDARAKHVVIYKTAVSAGETKKILDEDLKEHPGLNGAYYFDGIPGDGHNEPIGTSASVPEHTDPEPETLPDYIIQSDVNNPWVFKSSGYNSIGGVGTILGISTVTQALSQNQHGPSPLLVFSDNGVYSMQVDNTGQYDYISNVSREICINPGCILQTDNAVFFVSKKGLMAAVQEGDYRNIVVHCVSERMNGRAFNTSVLSPLAANTDWASIVSACQDSTTFLDFIRPESDEVLDEIFMAYDYIDSRIVIVNTNYDYSYVYSLADGTISKTILPASMRNAINDYPDYLLQGMDGNLYSFYEKPREEQINTRQLGFLLTRPMKLAGPVSQTSLRQLMNVGTWDPGTDQTPLSVVKTQVYISSDMRTWYNDISRFGAAARYYRLALFVKMLPTERLSGTILTEQPRRSNNMR